MNDPSFKAAPKLLMSDLAAELVALEETFRGAQERSAAHLTLAMKALSEAEPILPAGKRLKKALEHSLGVLMELSAISTGLSDGFIHIFQAQLTQESPGEN